MEMRPFAVPVEDREDFDGASGDEVGHHGVGESIPREVIAVAPRFVARSELLESLGVEVVEQPPGIGSRVAADTAGRTNVPGVWVAGNITDLAAQVVVAAAAGTATAAQINADLVAEDLQHAMAVVR